MSEAALRAELVRVYALLIDLQRLIDTHESYRNPISLDFVSDRIENTLNGIPAPETSRGAAAECFAARFPAETTQEAPENG